MLSFLFFVIVEIPVMLICFVLKLIIKGVHEIRAIRAANTTPSAKQAKPEELSEEQKEKIVDAIILDALLINDSVYDNLQCEGEALYPAADACKCESGKTFDLQYGEWIQVWARSLERWFDCRSIYEGGGNFRCRKGEAV